MKNSNKKSEIDILSGRKHKLKDYFFFYSWSDLDPIEHIRDVWVTIYVAWGVVGVLFNPLKERGASFIVFAFLANYPGSLLGTVVQKNSDPVSLQHNGLMVWQLGNVAKIFSLIGAVFLARAIFA